MGYRAGWGFWGRDGMGTGCEFKEVFGLLVSGRLGIYFIRKVIYWGF